MAYGLIIDNVLVQKQVDEAPGFVEIPEEAVCGMVWDGEAWEVPPPPEPETPVYPTEVIISSPNGTPFKVIVDDDGTPATEQLTKTDGGTSI